ncbi:MAG TPA: hemerythrin domain-containing protein [Micromonosporaceae bacterium]|nr:hemerythrin domain-containing protein [Micromonosporaceae bacterium]
MQPRVVALGQHLVEVHGWLRKQLDAIRTDAAAFGEHGGIRATDLRTHCLTFCSILEHHHTGEDQQLFPFIAGQYPELGPVIEELMHDHGQVAEILNQITELVRQLGAQPDPAEVARIRTELDSLAALLENHLNYEEKKLVPILDAL